MTIKKKNIRNKKSKILVAPLSIQNAKEVIRKNTLSKIGASDILADLAEKKFPEMYASGNLMPTLEISESINKVSIALSLDTGHILAESVPERYRVFATEFKQELQKEYDCKTATEKALVDQAVNAHIRKLNYSKLMEGHNEPEWLSNERVAFLNFYSREVDRAHRHFISCIETLKSMKQPVMQVNIKTKNAFVSEKQQFNTKVENNEAK